MRIMMLAITVCVIALLGAPAHAQEEAAIAACVHEARTENGLSEADLSRMRPGDPFRIRGREYFIGRGEFPRDTCRRALAFERAIAEEAQKAEAAVTRAETAEVNFTSYRQRQTDEVNSPEYRYRHATAIVTIITIGGIALYVLSLFLRQKKRRSSGGGAFDRRR